MGLGLWGLDSLFTLFLPSMLVDALLLAFLAMVTGALHLDGFVDTCDGLAARGTASEKLRAMKDGKAGAVGTAAVFLMVLSQFASLTSLPQETRAEALIIMPVLSRWAMAYAIWAFPSAREEGMGWMMKQGASWRRMAVACGLSLVIVWALLGWWGLILPAALTIIALVFGRYLCASFGGLSGDSYGAINEVAKLTFLVLIYIIWGQKLI